MRNENNIKTRFKKPTVAAVFALMCKAAENYNLQGWEDVSQLIDVSPRTFRRWKAHVDDEPDSLSTISFSGYANLFALAEQRPFIQPLTGVDTRLIPARLIMTAAEYTPDSLTSDDIRQIIGLKSITGLGIKQIAVRIGLAPNVLAQQIKRDNQSYVSYQTWALILQLCGAPVSCIF